MPKMSEQKYRSVLLIKKKVLYDFYQLTKTLTIQLNVCFSLNEDLICTVYIIWKSYT